MGPPATSHPGSTGSLMLNNFLALQRLAKGGTEAFDMGSDEYADELESSSQDNGTEDSSSDVVSTSDLASQGYKETGSSVMPVCSLIFALVFMFSFINDSLLQTLQDSKMP